MKNSIINTAFFRLLSLALLLFLAPQASAQSLPGTKPLEMKGDLARQMLDGIDRYLTRATAASVAKRQDYWKPDYASAGAYAKSVQPKRDRFKKIIGAVDERLPIKELEYVGGTNQEAVVAQTQKYTVYAVRWPVLPGVYGEGLLLEPKGKAKACVVVIPDADQTPEMWVGLAPGLQGPDWQLARMLAEEGCRVVVPTLINRQDTWSGSEKLQRFTNQTHREFIYRMAFEMGRHIIGYEVQKVLALVDWFSPGKDAPPVAVFGYGEGGLLALFSSALDTRIRVTVVDGYTGPREEVYKEPIYRNIWSQLREFGDGEIVKLIAPRVFFVWTKDFRVGIPPAARPGRSGAAPGTYTAPLYASVMDELARVIFTLPNRPDDRPNVFTYPAHLFDMSHFLEQLGVKPDKMKIAKEALKDNRNDFNPDQRQKRQFDQLVDYTQKLLPAAKQRREEFFWSKLDTSSLDKLRKSQEPLRDYFWKEIIGKLPEPTMPMNPRTRLVYETPKWKGYEVVLDVYEDVFSFGILLVPNDIKPGERRPCVVCQHGLEGRPADVVNPKEKTRAYNSFGAQLADQGFVVFAPQNPYIFKNDFRQVVRKANPLQLTLYSFIVRQHQRILEWLKTLDFVDGTRIAFYGLSYGGKVAMRIPALLLDYCLSICAGDFNEWIWKNITLEWQGSYMFSGEYEMVEFDLGNTFNYAEMAALIAPRPFMVERGHADGVGLDEYVAFEYAKVRRFYAKMGIADRTAIEFFQGGHEIHLQGTLAFLRKHLRFPK
jgi:cephalosporin-C deacetylase-like acetyl esterase